MTTNYDLTGDGQARRLRDERDACRRTVKAVLVLCAREAAHAATVVRIADVRDVIARNGAA